MRSIKVRGGLTRGRGFTEAVRNTWVYSLHRNASLTCAVNDLTHLSYESSEHHIDATASRVSRDNEDVEKLVGFFKAHNPWDPEDSSIRSIFTGLSASSTDKINCDDVEKIGSEIQENYADLKCRRSHMIKSLDTLQNCIKIDGEALKVDSCVLFSRLIIQAERSHDPKAYFVYELAHEPTSLFKNGLMRKANKALLAQAIKKDVRFTDTVANPKCVVDGGSLLHRVKWILPSTYSKIADAYVSYVDKHYGKAAMIVFDGYRCGPTTKDAEHERRASKMMAHVKLSNENIAKGPQAAFLTNKENKAELINLLKSAFKKTGHHCLQASGDADCFIVKAALESSLLEETTVVCDDTDIFVMLLYHYDSQRSKGLNW